jgi:hypothetical protein
LNCSIHFARASSKIREKKENKSIPELIVGGGEQQLVAQLWWGLAASDSRFDKSSFDPFAEPGHFAITEQRVAPECSGRG